MTCYFLMSVNHNNCFRFNENCWKKAYAEENVLGCPSDEGQVWRIKFQSGQKNEWMDAADNLEVTCSPGKMLLLLFCQSFIDYAFFSFSRLCVE